MLSAVRAKVNAQQQAKTTQNPYDGHITTNSTPTSKSFSNDVTLILDPISADFDLSTRVPDIEWYDVPQRRKGIKVTPEKGVEKSQILNLNSQEKNFLKKNLKNPEIKNLSDQEKVKLNVSDRFLAAFEIHSFSHPIFSKQIREKVSKFGLECEILVLDREDLGLPATLLVQGPVNKISRFESAFEKINFKKTFSENSKFNIFLEKNSIKKIFCHKIYENLLTKKFQISRLNKPDYISRKAELDINDDAITLDIEVDPLAGLF